MASPSPKKNTASITPYLPPGGIPLMEGPLEGATSTLEKQQHYLLEEIEEKLGDIEYEQEYEDVKILLFIWCTLSGVAGGFLVMYALGATDLFASTRPHGAIMWSALSCGSICMLPCLVWFKYVFLPNKQQRDSRRLMHAKRRERVDEQARVVKEKLRLAKIDDEKKEAARKLMEEQAESRADHRESNRRSTSGGPK